MQAQNRIVDAQYMKPALKAASDDGLSALGQYVYYDAIVVHGDGDDASSFGGIRKAAKQAAKTPAQGGDEAEYLDAFLDARTEVMEQEEAHRDLSRIEAQRKFIAAKNWNLALPLKWTMYGDSYTLTQQDVDAMPSADA